MPVASHYSWNKYLCVHHSVLSGIINMFVIEVLTTKYYVEKTKSLCLSVTV